MTYLEALAQGLIVKGNYKETSDFQAPKEYNIIGIRGWENMNEA